MGAPTSPFRAQNPGVVASVFLVLMFAFVVLTTGEAIGQNAEKSADKSASESASSDKAPAQSIVHRSLTLVRNNPLGLQEEYQLALRTSLSDSDHVLLRDTYFSIGPQMMVSPSLQRFGLRATLKPLAILELFGLVEYLWFLGNYDYVQSYSDASADHSPDALKAGTARGENYQTVGLSMALSARLQIKAGPLAIRSTSRFNRYWLDTKGQDPVWYDIYWDILSPRLGWTLLQDNDLLFVRGRLVVGVRHTWTRSWLSPAAMAPVAKGAPRPDSTHRIGPLIAWRLVDDAKHAAKVFRRPTLLLLAQFWALHPYRAGQQVSQANPWLVLALAFDGQLDPAP